MIRAATLDDVPQIVALTKLHFPKLRNKQILFNEQTFTGFAERFIAGKDNSRTVLLSDESCLLCAFIFCMVQQHYLTGELVGSKVIWCAHPGMAGHGRKVLKAAEEWWHSKGVRRYLMSCFDSRTEKLLSLSGYYETEKHFEKVV